MKFLPMSTKCSILVGFFLTLVFTSSTTLLRWTMKHRNDWRWCQSDGQLNLFWRRGGVFFLQKTMIVLLIHGPWDQQESQGEKILHEITERLARFISETLSMARGSCSTSYGNHCRLSSFMHCDYFLYPCTDLTEGGKRQLSVRMDLRTEENITPFSRMITPTDWMPLITPFIWRAALWGSRRKILAAHVTSEKKFFLSKAALYFAVHVPDVPKEECQINASFFWEIFIALSPQKWCMSLTKHVLFFWKKKQNNQVHQILWTTRPSKSTWCVRKTKRTAPPCLFIVCNRKHFKCRFRQRFSSKQGLSLASCGGEQSTIKSCNFWCRNKS